MSGQNLTIAAVSLAVILLIVLGPSLWWVAVLTAVAVPAASFGIFCIKETIYERNKR